MPTRKGVKVFYLVVAGVAIAVVAMYVAAAIYQIRTIEATKIPEDVVRYTLPPYEVREVSQPAKDDSDAKRMDPASAQGTVRD